MNWKKIDANCFESENQNFYFHLRKEEESWILDIFENKEILKYVESFEFIGPIDAKNDAENYILYLR